MKPALVNDTPAHIEARVREMMMRRSGAERMGASMFDTARQMVLASLPPDLPEREKKVQLFLRIYGDDFDEEKRQAIVEHLRRAG